MADKYGIIMLPGVYPMKHKHHIIPRHMGGTDAPENLVEVTVEQHAELHLALYLEHGHWEDYLAAMSLSGIIDREEVVSTLLSEAGKKGGSNGKGKTAWNKGKKIGANAKLKEYHKTRIYTEEQKEKMRQGAIKSGKLNKGRKRPDLAERNRKRNLDNQKRDELGRFM